MTDAAAVAQRWVEVRRKTGLSREKFAQRVGLTPGAVWRIENKGVLKTGELDKLESALAEVVEVVGPVKPKVLPTASQLILAPVTSLVRTVAPTVDADPLAEDWLGLNEWVDVADVPVWTRPLEERVGVELAVTEFLAGKIEVTSALPASPTLLSTFDGFTRYSNSELYTFKDCRRRWWLAFYRGLRPRSEPVTSVREIGSRVHAALRAWYAPPGVAPVDPRDALEKLLAADWLTLAARLQAEEGAVPLGVETAFKKEADLQRLMVAGYLDWLKETGADSEYRVVEPEAYLEADLPELGDVKIIAKLDARVLRTSDNLRMVLEHKTVGGFQQKLATIVLDEQVLHQLLVESLQPGEQSRVAGVLYNMIRRSRRGQTAKPPFFQRVEVHHSQRELDSFRTRVVATIGDLQEARARLDAGEDPLRVVYPRPSGDCSWKCPFVQACPMFDDGSRVESALNAHFEVGDPYAYYVDKPLPESEE